jgi:excisionase family DNA binding protein
MSDELIKALKPILQPLIADEVSSLLPSLIGHLRPDEEKAKQISRIGSEAYLKTWEAALYLNVSEGHIDNMIADDPTFPASRIGRNIRINRVELEKYVRDKARPKPQPLKSVTGQAS